MTKIHSLPRGIRNNNPGNIRKTTTHWRGEVHSQQETAFETFAEPVDGLRALMVLLLNYYVRYQLNDVASIINRWAPPHENDTGAYARAVAERLKVTPAERINLFDDRVLTTLAAAITVHENGRPPAGYPPAWYQEGVYQQAADLAFRAVRGTGL